MNTLLILAVALLPVVLLLGFIYWKDPIKEPASQLAKAFFGGVVIFLPIAFIELILEKAVFAGAEPTQFWGILVDNFFLVSLIEEGFKLLVLWLVVRKNPYFDEHFDGIVYAVFVGLGFAAVENFGYLLDSSNIIWKAVLRTLLSVPGHYAYAVIMGYCFSMYHFVGKQKKYAIFALLIPFIAHGIYDTVLSLPQLASMSKTKIIIAIVGFLTIIYFMYKVQRIAYNRICQSIQKDKELQQEKEQQDTLSEPNQNE